MTRDLIRATRARPVAAGAPTNEADFSRLELAGFPPIGATFDVLEATSEAVVIWDRCEPVRMSVTNDAGRVIQRLHVRGLGARRLFYYDSAGNLDELVHDGAGLFLSFKPGPGRQHGHA